MASCWSTYREFAQRSHRQILLQLEEVKGLPGDTAPVPVQWKALSERALRGSWVHMLLHKSASRVMVLSEQIFPSLFNCLSNPSEDVVRLDIEALAIMASSTQQHFGPFIEHLLTLFRDERPCQ